MNRRSVRRALTCGLSRMPWQILRTLHGTRIASPFYHAVSDRVAPHLRYLFPVPSVSSFQRDLEFFVRHFVPVALDDVLDHAQGCRQLPKRALFLSFDDGLAEVAESIAPLCKRMGIPATFFLTTGFLDNENLCFRNLASLIVDALQCASAAAVSELGRIFGLSAHSTENGVRERVLGARWGDSQLLEAAAKALDLDVAEYLRSRRPYLATADVEQLLRDGFTIGAHSVSHPLFADISLEMQIAETTQSVSALQSRFGMRRATFAFPFVSDGVTQAFYDAIWPSGVEMAFCVGGTPRNDPRVAQRLWMERGIDRGASRLFREAYADEAVGRFASLFPRHKTSR